MPLCSPSPPTIDPLHIFLFSHLLSTLLPLQSTLILASCGCCSHLMLPIKVCDMNFLFETTIILPSSLAKPAGQLETGDQNDLKAFTFPCLAVNIRQNQNILMLEQLQFLGHLSKELCGLSIGAY